MTPSPLATRFAHDAESVINTKSPYPGRGKYVLSVMPGRRFDRIVLERTEAGRRTTRSCHAFVERNTGLLIKAAGWAAPQKSETHASGLAARFNLSDPIQYAEAVFAAEFSGGYLYQR